VYHTVCATPFCARNAQTYVYKRVPFAMNDTREYERLLYANERALHETRVCYDNRFRLDPTAPAISTYAENPIDVTTRFRLFFTHHRVRRDHLYD